MILVDANLLIYAGVAGGAEHRLAADWLTEQLCSGRRVGLPWSSLIAYLRITTNPRLFERPATIMEAMGVLDGWLQFPNVWIPGPTERHRKIFWELAGTAKTTGNLVPDAHLAAIAIEHGLELYTADGDFSRFEGLRWKNPLRGSRPS